jgi:hypothetical protein
VQVDGAALTRSQAHVGRGYEHGGSRTQPNRTVRQTPSAFGIIETLGDIPTDPWRRFGVAAEPAGLTGVGVEQVGQVRPPRMRGVDPVHG